MTCSNLSADSVISCHTAAAVIEFSVTINILVIALFVLSDNCGALNVIDSVWNVKNCT